MVYAFTESEKRKVESTGLMVVQYKRFLEKALVTFEAGKRIIELLEKAGEVFVDVLEKVWDIAKTLADKVNSVIETAFSLYSYPTARCYHVVKVINKCTGIEKRDIWKLTRKVYFARSCC